MTANAECARDFSPSPAFLYVRVRGTRAPDGGAPFAPAPARGRLRAVSDGPPSLAFDRAAHLRTDLGQLERALNDAESLIVPVWRDLTLVHDDERVARIEVGHARELLDKGELVWLGRMEGRSCFAVDVSQMDEPLDHPALEGDFKDLRFIGAALPAEDAALAAYARGILYWHTRQQHCGVCGTPTSPREGGHMRECRDERCATKHFPRTDPAVIMLVHDGDRCLVGRQRRWPTGMYSTLAGFVEPGETIEEAVTREVLEEAGVHIEHVRYFRSQPWPFPSSLMIGFMARAGSTEIDVGDDELEDARWITREQLADPKTHGFFVPGTFSLSGQLLQAFLEDRHDPAGG